MKEISGKLVYFCAGADKRILEGGDINGLLLNVPESTKSERAIKRTLDFIRACGAKNTMLDSGGYQLYESQRKGLEITQNSKEPMFQEGRFNINPWHVANAAEALRPDILVALDFPVRKIEDLREQEKEFRSKLKLNVKWTIQTAELREKYCPKIKLFIPIQCYTLVHLDIFFKRIQGIHYDGVSMPVRNLSLKEISLFLLRFHQMGIKRVHLLGTSSFYTIVLSAFMAHRFFNWISLDSSTWKKAAGYSEYLNPDLTRTWIVDDGVKSREKELACKCPVCLGKTFSEIKKLKKRVVALQIHNYWAIEKAVRDAYKNSRSLGSVKRFLNRTCSNKQMSQQLYQCLEELDGFITSS
jgi:tRNA-guanine family transglycosylase